jgi:methylmalonyl-CoA/ethylmalonyl-CoA epimerase
MKSHKASPFKSSSRISAPSPQAQISARKGVQKSTAFEDSNRIFHKDWYMRFHHIGYAVKDIRSYLDDFLIPMFSPVSVSDPVADPVQQVTVCFAQMQGGTVIELVEPMGKNSPVNSVIGNSRGGLYHVCYEVDDIEIALEHFRRKRCLPLGEPVSATAFDGRRIVFLLTQERDIIELVERPPSR